ERCGGAFRLRLAAGDEPDAERAGIPLLARDVIAVAHLEEDDVGMGAVRLAGELARLRTRVDELRAEAGSRFLQRVAGSGAVGAGHDLHADRRLASRLRSTLRPRSSRRMGFTM